MRRRLSILGLCLFITSAPAWATMIWDGSGSPADVGYVAGGSAGAGLFTFDSPPGQMHQALGGGQSGNWTLATGSEMLRAAGWIVDFRFHTLQATGDGYGGVIASEDDVGMVLACIYPTSIDFKDGNASTVFSTAVPADFNTVRFSMAPGAASVDVYVNSTWQGQIPAGVVGAGYSRTHFGDGSSQGDAEIQWDYVNVNIPEPATMALLGAGGLALLRRRRTSV